MAEAVGSASCCTARRRGTARRGPGPGLSGGRNADTACSLPSEDVRRTGTGYVARSGMPSLIAGTPFAHESTSLLLVPRIVRFRDDRDELSVSGDDICR